MNDHTLLKFCECPPLHVYKVSRVLCVNGVPICTPLISGHIISKLFLRWSVLSSMECCMCVWACLCVQVWRPGVHSSYLPLSLSSLLLLLLLFWDKNLSLSLGLAVWARVTSQLYCLICPSLSPVLQPQVHAIPVVFLHVCWGSEPGPHDSARYPLSHFPSLKIYIVCFF